MRHKARDSGGTLLLLLCRHIGLMFRKRLHTNVLRHRIRKYPDSPVLTISPEFVDDLFFPLWRGDLKVCEFAVNFARWVWMEAVSGKKVADSKISGTVWMGPITSVLVDTRLLKAKHPQKRFQNLGQSCVLSTNRIEIHQSQPASMT